MLDNQTQEELFLNNVKPHSLIKGIISLPNMNIFANQVLPIFNTGNSILGPGLYFLRSISGVS